MKRAIGSLMFLVALGPLSLSANSLCTGSLAQMIASGVCTFDIYSIEVTSFSNSGSTVANPLTASDIFLTATPQTDDTGVNIQFTLSGNQSFIANNAPAGGSVTANYLIDFTIMGPAVYTTETLAVVGGSATPLLASYTDTENANGTADTVTNKPAQTQTKNLPGSPTVLNVSDTLLLSASTTKRGLAGTAKFTSFSDQFTNEPVPEPAALLLCGSGLLVFSLLKRRGGKSARSN